jgi:hypothetical protein
MLHGPETIKTSNHKNQKERKNKPDKRFEPTPPEEQAFRLHTQPSAKRLLRIRRHFLTYRKALHVEFLGM